MSGFSQFRSKLRITANGQQELMQIYSTMASQKAGSWVAATRAFTGALIAHALNPLKSSSTTFSAIRVTFSSEKLAWAACDLSLAVNDLIGRRGATLPQRAGRAPTARPRNIIIIIIMLILGFIAFGLRPWGMQQSW